MKNPTSIYRVVLWSGVALLANLAYRKVHPVAWKLALFAGVFALLWELISHAPRRKKHTETEDAFTPSEDAHKSRSPFPALFVDLGATLTLLYATNGLQSPFLPLLLFPVLEANSLFGRGTALKTAGAIALFLPVCFLKGASVTTGTLYIISVSVLFVLAGMAGATPQESNDEEDDTPELFGGKRRRTFRLLEGTIQTLESERDRALAERTQIRDTYSEVARLHREQKTQIARLEATSQILGVHLSTEASDTSDKTALTAVLTILMDSFEARSGVIWMREAGGERLTPISAEGNGFTLSRMHSIEKPGEMFPSELRLTLENELISYAPPSALTSGNTLALQGMTQGMVPYPTIVALVRTQDGEGILGAIGLCDGRGASRFNDSDFERLQEAALPLAQTFRAIEERNSLRRRNLELTTLYDLSRLFQTSTGLEQVNLAAVHKAHTLLNGLDTALYYFDRAKQQMVLQTSRGTAIDLLEFAIFGEPDAKGKPNAGLKGWFNGGAKQFSLPDLASGIGVYDVENLPIQSGSFAATPIVVQGRLVGMMTHYSPQPHAFDAPTLKTVERVVEQLGIALERTETYATLEQMAMTDTDTGLASSRYFRYRFSEEFTRVQHFETDATLILIALDRRETLVARYGSPFTESLLKTVAQTLENVLPETCLPARYDETRLAILLPHTDFGKASEIFDALKTHASTTERRTADGKKVTLSLSAGIASLTLHGSTPEEVLQSAETALCEAQAHGGDRYAIAETFAQIAALLPATLVEAGSRD